MRKWELITDLFDNKAGDLLPEFSQDRLFKGLIMIPIEGGCYFVDPKRYPKHFRLVEEPEFAESDMIEAMLLSSKTMPDYNNDIIETIRKRKVGK